MVKILSPFGPKIGKLKFSNYLIKKINTEVDKIISNKKLAKKFDYSKKLVGQVKQEIYLPKSFVKKNLDKTINKNITDFIKKSIGKKVKKIKIKKFWVVRQFSNEYNPVHFHDGHISGVGYLKLPKFINAGKKNLKTNGTIDFINGNKMFLNESIFNHTPKVGDVLLFPNYLMHTVYPFSSEGERRSFSFNVEIDRGIANIFSK
ncbi:MAG: putative 2OG-Fe(II) oxygenase [Pelagibacterales bacterium]|nr:putative 2OG-Fe(II) oxygenase [Pelagibacterales bacterium]|tara:strand:+ start:491 stop:1102 length:612 start_codon:yes stop_codon:yes gene_type:complete